MRISELEDDFLPLHFGAVTDADDVELFLESLGHTLDVVRDERADEAMQRARFSFIVLTRELHDVVLDLHVDAFDERRRERPFRTLHRDGASVLLDFNAFRQRDLFSSDARHEALSLPDLAEHFAADAALHGFGAREHALRRGNDRQSQSAEDPRDVLLVAVDAATGTRDALDAVNDRLSILRILQIDTERRLDLLLDDFVVADETFALENARDLDLELRRRKLHAIVTRLNPVADSREHICDWISH